MSEKPKVLIIATHPVQYQVPWFRYLQQHVQDYNFEVLYLTTPDPDKQGTGFNQSFQWDIPMLDGYDWIKVKPHHLKGNRSLDGFFSIRLTKTKKLIQSRNPDAVLLTGWQCLGLVQVLIACKQLKVPCLIRAESNNLKPRQSYKRLIHRLLLKQYDLFLAIGQANRYFYLDNGISEKVIYSCPYFVDNNFFAEQSSIHKNQTSILRNEWNIPKHRFCFCYVGKLNPKKRIIDVLSALNQIQTDDVHLLVVGDGELMQQAKNYADAHQLNVSFIGFLNQSEITKAYVVSDCLILASDYDETWGLVVNEAMVCGIPAIVSDRCGCHIDLITEGQTGFVFEFANINDLTEKMEIAKNLSADDFSRVCETANRNIMHNYSIETATIGLVKALNNYFRSQ